MTLHLLNLVRARTKDKGTKGDPRSGRPLRAVFHTFCERSLGEKAS
eukprot:SAG31_NODE_30065_length_385_cov_39.293706_1_plen_45_part_10